jgi:hypothetical protein
MMTHAHELHFQAYYQALDHDKAGNVTTFAAAEGKMSETSPFDFGPDSAS